MMELATSTGADSARNFGAVLFGRVVYGRMPIVGNMPVGRKRFLQRIKNMPEKMVVHFAPDSLRFGGDDAKKLTHIFSLHDFFEWCRTISSQKELTAFCGAVLRPQFMGTMQVGENLCPTCGSQCIRHVFER